MYYVTRMFRLPSVGVSLAIEVEFRTCELKVVDVVEGKLFNMRQPHCSQQLQAGDAYERQIQL